MSINNMAIKKMIVIVVFVMITSTMIMSDTTNDFYYQYKLSDLKIVEGQVPDYNSELPPVSNITSRTMWVDYMQPYAVAKNDAEIFFFSKKIPSYEKRIWYPFQERDFLQETSIIIRTQSKHKTSGFLFLPKPDLSGMIRLGFETPDAEPSKDQKAVRDDYLNAMSNHYNHFVNLGLPGTPWFRHRSTTAKNAMHEKRNIPNSHGDIMSNNRPHTDELDSTFSLFNGGRALSENLQFDRNLLLSPTKEETIPLKSIKGITTLPMDWHKEIAGQQSTPDFLAARIPADQHALFFPSFQAMMDLMDEIDSRGTPILQLLEPRSEDALTRQRYQRQLCLPTSELSRLLGPTLVKSVAFTGSDPYLRTGTDLAILFETENPTLLKSTFLLRHELTKTATPGCQSISNEYLGVPFIALISSDRSICSYIAVIDDHTVTVTNSKVQLENLIQVTKGKTPPLSSLDEYTFFRNRYKKGETDEVALLVLSDATIRRWCSPRWRIADSRRTRAAAIMMKMQIQNLKNLANTISTTTTSTTNPILPPVILPVYGSLDFLTPICEMKIEKVSADEALVYEWFRDHYQKEWQKYFDPIAIRFTLNSSKIGIDLTIRPLIMESSYRSLMEISGNAAITPQAGDRHGDALIHYLISLDRQSRPVQQASNMMAGMSPKLGGLGLNWMGNWLSFYMDNDPFWQDLEDAQRKDSRDGTWKFMEDNLHRFPAALVLDVSDSLKLTLFLAGLRTFIEQTAPGLTTWESLTYNNHPYVRITATDRQGGGQHASKLQIFYAPAHDFFILTLSEKVLKAFLQRRTTSQPNNPPASEPNLSPWLGKSMCFTARDPVLKVMRLLYGNPMKSALQRRAWGNIAILNEWRHLFHTDSPLEFHLRYWQTKLLCPGGGQYVWNDQYQTYESTVFGHPGQPKEMDVMADPLYNIIEANLGITFEKNGLRAKGELTYKNK